MKGDLTYGNRTSASYAAYSDVQGYTTDAYENFISAAGGTSADIEYDSTNINEKKNFKSIVQDFMQMQYAEQYRKRERVL